VVAGWKFGSALSCLNEEDAESDSKGDGGSLNWWVAEKWGFDEAVLSEFEIRTVGGLVVKAA
jgi:hypothetical protein